MSNGDEKDKTQESAERQVPLVEEDFTNLLKQYRLKPTLATNIAHNIATTGGESVFEDPRILYGRLIAWSGDIGPQNRRLILEEWFSNKGIEVPPDLLQKAGMSDKERKEVEEDEKTTGAARYVYDAEHKAVRFTRKGELGGTLAEAERLQKMAEGEEEESPFIVGEEGRLTLNPKARLSGVELFVWESIQKKQAAGEPVDPIEAMTLAAERIKTLREVFGGGEGGADWTKDPIEFMTRMKALSGDSAATETLQSELAETRRIIAEMKDEQLRGTIEAQQKQIEALTGKIGLMVDQVEKIRQGSVGRSEMDILHEAVTGGIDFIKTELPNFRKDAREMIGGIGMGSAKTTAERAQRKDTYRQALKNDQEIQELGNRLFLDRGR